MNLSQFSKNINLIKVLALGTFALQSCSSNIKTESSSPLKNAPLNVSNNYIQIATGQVKLYDEKGKEISNIAPNEALYGQDANYLKGKKMAFKNNNDGTITDQNTGLIWQEIPTKKGFDWNDAEKYTEDLKLGGYDDWRMPTAKELFSISDFNSGWPYIDTAYFSLVNNEFIDTSEQYWSSNKYVGHTEEGGFTAAFGVNYATGHIKAYAGEAIKNSIEQKGLPSGEENGQRSGGGGGKGGGRQKPDSNQEPNSNANRPSGNPNLKHVRAVRGTVYGINDFVDNKNGTITDQATGLMWSTNDSEKGLDWKNALQYAENSNLAGYTDWRLSNVKELQGIVDYSYAPDAKKLLQDGPAINPLFSTTEISNENGERDYPYFWTSTSARFQKGTPYYYAWYVAFGKAVNKEGKDFHGAGAVRFGPKDEKGPASQDAERYYNYVRLVRDVN